jgi:hypothetical protein
MTNAGAVSLEPVKRENVHAICDLEPAEGQRHLVAPAADTVVEGNNAPGSLLRAIYGGEAPRESVDPG